MKIIDCGWQYKLEGGTVAIKRLKFDIPIPDLRQMVLDNTIECDECNEPVRKGSKVCTEVEVYDRPFDDDTRTLILHFDPTYENYEVCSERIYDTSWSSFRYFNCEGCSRIVCEQNPSNGWHSQYRIVNECYQVCLRCYEENLLANGVDRESIENGELGGMFFSYGNPEPQAEGYEPLGDRFVGRDSQAEAVRIEILNLIDTGYQVVIGYESMAIGGVEGTISLHSKRKPVAVS